MDKSSDKTVFKIAVVCVIAAAAFLAGGCASGKAVKKEAAPVAAKPLKAAKEPQRPGYDEVLNAWTAGAKVYEGIETRLIATATYKDFSFRKAYIERYAKSYQIDDDYKKSLIERERAAADDSNEFFLSVYTPEERWNDLDSKDSVWRLFLEDDTGRRLIPISVKRVEKGDPFIREFFPYVDPWSLVYTVRFPKYSAQGDESIPGKESKFLKLTVTGILGKGEIIWRLKK
ncbi:MAG: hypothetical protein HZB82_07785 [Deltaproteobacteria bacterium]|nr:hypothetical protein [Deltaproteobacteria bacterium]